MKAARSLPVIFAFAGFALFGLALWRANLETPPTAEESRSLAHLEVAFGDVTVEFDGHRDTVMKRRALQRLETVETGLGAEAVLSFPNGEEVRVLENSAVLGDFEGGRAVLIIKAGDIWAEKLAETGASVLISRNGVRRTLAEDQRARQEQNARDNAGSGAGTGDGDASTKAGRAPAKKLSSTTPSRPVGDIDARRSLETLTADYIQETVRTQRNSFFKCYGQLLQKTPGQTGDASVAFTIERNGRVSVAEVASTSFQDPQFKRCLTEAVRRIEFRSFAGEPVQTLFPIRFE